MDVKTVFKGLSLTGFLEEMDAHHFFWVVKRLSGNDTGLTGGHQSGLYLPRVFFERMFPEICTQKKYNPDTFIGECYIPNADIAISGLRAIYYNSRYFPEKGLQKKYDEFRITRWGGSANPLQDPENTGSICVFAVLRTQPAPVAVAWVASSIEEENIVEGWLGQEVEPGRFNMKLTGRSERPGLPGFEVPEEWLTVFPSGRDIFEYITRLLPRPAGWRSIDELLLKRRDIEFQIFEHIEQRDVLPNIKNGFDSVEAFIKYAHSVSNRRKSRTGTSLELNLEAVFRDEKIAFETQVTTENRKKPDFLFPSGRAYHDREFPGVKLHMLASKTCCKDRWRQILNEADRISPKHLFTLQQGVSGHQLQEMKASNVELVVPAPLVNSFPAPWRKSLMTLEKFVQYIKIEQSSVSGLEKWTK
jgi:hypothetical protein